MRVLYYLDSLNRGGAEIQTLDVCRNASRFGIDIVVAAGEGDLCADFRDSGVPFYTVRRRMPVDASLVSTLRDIIKREKIQIVHSSQPVEGLHLFLASHSLNIGRVQTFHGFLPDRKNRWAARFLISRLDANLVVSRELSVWLEKFTGLDLANTLQVIHNGPDPERLSPTGYDVRKELGIPSDALVIGMIGNFYRDQRKDQTTLAAALGKIAERIPDLHCLFVGKTESGAENKVQVCKNIINEAGLQDRVHFTGPRNDIPDVLAALDLFVLSSFHEGLPVALIEAMLAGVPALVSDIGPHREATAAGTYAKIFRTADPDDLAEKTVVLLKDPEMRAGIAAKAKTFAYDNFSIGAHLKSLRRVYEEVLSK